MNMYLISYDLIKVKDYETLYKAIRSYENYAHINESLWAIRTNQSIIQVRDYLISNMDKDDKLFITKSTGDWGSFNISKEIINWLNGN